MSDLDEFKATYFDECSELLNELEEQFVAIEEGDRDADRLNAVFRAIHSVKGGAGAFGFADLVGFAHEFETLLDFVRNGKVEMTDDVVALCIRSNDLVASFVEAARSGTELDADYGAEEKAQFVALCTGEGGADEDGEPMEEFDIDFTPVAVTIVQDDDDDEEEALEMVDDGAEDASDADFSEAADTAFWRVKFSPARALYERANDPLLLLRELGELGEMKVELVDVNIPALSDFEPFGIYCAWQIELRGAGIEEAAILEVFEFVEGDCTIEVEKVEAGAQSLTFDLDGVDDPAAADEAAQDLAFDAGDALAAVDASEDAAPENADQEDAAPEKAEVAKEEEPEMSFADLAAEMAPPPKAAPTPPAAKPASEPKAAASAPAAVQSIRVDLDKVDRVVNMVGELVITQSMLTQQMDDHLKARYQELVRGLEVLAQTTRGLQDSVMAIRAQPVKSVFSRMPRMMRELAGKTGKKVRLEMVGENTEIDKTVIEQLSDPLTHMIRNSADHGIEMPDERVGKGKPEVGIVRLSAEQAGGNILISVEDDGAGINRERVLQIAKDRGVVGPDQQMSDEQIDNLIFAPGFSTADEISDISGRGVGMDVVLSNIKKIGGSVHVRSWPGKGTRMTLRLPLTLAVLDVMLVTVGQSPYVIPLSSIVETMQCARAEFGHMPTGGRVLQVRGEYVQVIDLVERFQMDDDADEASRFVVLCEAEGSVKVALIVDDIIGQQQVVIKSLEENFERIEGIAGGTILGDGSVALIVDVQGLRTTPNHLAAA